MRLTDKKIGDFVASLASRAAEAAVPSVPVPKAADAALAEEEFARRVLAGFAADDRRNGRRRRTLADFPKVVPERDDPSALVKGRWLERGGSAFLVSTAGTGKSIWATQFALSMVHAVPFSGLSAWRPLTCWVIQSEDSDSRVAIDRDDITAGLAEQWAATYPEIDWGRSCERVEFPDFTGYTGAAFVARLRSELEAARDADELPDVVVVNPFMDFMGGDVASNADCIAFLSGGLLGGVRTEGLRAVLRAFGVAALFAHHTGKPPTEAEIGAWIMSPMPEYKACGASYVTNWGRSFVTMMKVPGFEGRVMLTAGKNGGALGWPSVAGARRIFLAWSDAPSCSGTGLRHFWRLVTDEERRELEEAVERLAAGKRAQNAASATRTGLGARGEGGEGDSLSPFDERACAAFWAGRGEILGKGAHELREIVFDGIRREGRSYANAKVVIAELFARPDEYGLAVRRDKFGKKWLERQEG